MKNFLKSTNVISIFGLLSLFVFSIVLYSCGKESISEDEEVVLSDEDLDILTEEYIYQGVSYFISYDESDENGLPISSEDLNLLEAAIGNKEYIAIVDPENWRKNFLYDSEEKEYQDFDFNIEDIELESTFNHVSNRSPLMDYFEHNDFRGDHLNGDAVSGIACRGTGCCSKLIHRSNLSGVPRGNSTWNDVISSLTADASSEVTSARDMAFLILFRDSGFPTRGCRRKVVPLNPRQVTSASQNPSIGRTISSSSLGGRWCFRGGRMNDSISGFAMSICRTGCDNCWGTGE